MTLRASATVLAGAVIGVAAYHAVLMMGARHVVSSAELKAQAERMAALEEENRELTDELLRPRDPTPPLLDSNHGPYTGDDDAWDEIIIARADSKDRSRFLMVTFGANWCYDCRNLHRMLETDEVREYTDGLFDFFFVDVGKLNQNRHVAERLGVDLDRGIPVAVLFAPDGALIGTTNDGQLESARYYSSKQILRFVRDVAERSRIVAPDAIR